MIDYEQSVDEISAARPGFFMAGSPKEVVLLLHGLGGNSSGMRPLANYLVRQKGVSVEALTLPGHAGAPEDLLSYDRNDWRKKVADEYQKLQALYPQVVILGTSLGSLLALDLATRQPLERVIALSCPLIFKNKAISCSSFVAHFKTYHVWKGLPLDGNEVKANLAAYRKIPYKSLAEVTKLRKEVVANLAGIRCPVLDLYGAKDGVVAPTSVAYLQSRITTPFEAVVYPEGYHSLLFSPAAEDVFKKIASTFPQYN